MKERVLGPVLLLGCGLGGGTPGHVCVLAVWRGGPEYLRSATC
jgi:hypothetical protein